MRKAMVRDLLSHRGRLVVTLLSIALGVAAAVASWVVSDSVATTLAGATTRDDVGAVVRGPVATDALRALPGVVRVDEVVVGRAGPLGRDGKLISTKTALDQAGTTWSDSPRFHLPAGRRPVGPEQVAVDRSLGVAVGAKVEVLLSEGRRRVFEVSGVFDYTPLGPRDEDPEPAVAFDGPGVLLGEVNRVELTGPGLDLERVRQAAPGAAVRAGADVAEAGRAQAREDAADLRATLLPFAVVALLVGLFVIANAFTILITQRTRQFALLRAVGAKRRQVRMAVVGEAVVLGLAGGTVGCGLGVGLGPLVLAAMRPGDDMTYSVSFTAIALGYGLALLVTVAAAHGAARRAAKVPPVAALRTDAVEPTRVVLGRTVVGLALVATAVVAVVATADPSAETLPRLVGIGAALVGATGVLLLAPVMASALFRRLPARGRPAWRLGVRAAARDPRRTASTASAITVGLGLVVAFGTVGATFTDLIASTTLATVPPSTTVAQPAPGAVLTPRDLAAVASAPGVSAVAASREVVVGVRYAGGETERKASAIEPDALGTVLTPRITAGVADLRAGLVISRNQADMLGLGLGDVVTLVSEHPVSRPVVGIYDATELQASIYYDVALAPRSIRDRQTSIYATGPDPAAARAGVTAAFAGRPDVTVTDREGLAAQGIAAQRAAFALMYAMFGLAVVIAVFGVVNTLALSVMERAREIGVLRAVGARRSLVRDTVRAESVVISLFGALLGVVVGLVVGAVLQHAMFGQRLWDLTVPYGVIALSLAGMVVLAVVAALWPARRAARTDPLTAIGTP
ncbi:ABC transporter permease [Actinokineospora auranticolor]|uniref:Putative ABC transport system permease protein n=1 Tax=Actinokineospora auranticolor TaxID=155976 RepID=A0A2S6H122_9PSEU|nr:ABC transporter permease [Actinokineospora auranticolor]PPK71131.1 putative ABC transport system permease protein [Actinokineospora auranticolor]